MSMGDNYTKNVSWWERRKRRKGLEEFPKKQEELLSLYEEDQKTLLNESKEQGFDERGPDRLLSRLAFILNVILLGTNLTASIMSGSLAVISTFVDSAMDVASNVIIALCLWMIKRTNYFVYPRGRERLEIIGVMVCSIIMGIAQVIMIMESVLTIVKSSMSVKVDVFTLCLIGGGMALKIILMIACLKRGTPATKFGCLYMTIVNFAPHATVLALDMRNDTLTSLMALFCALVGDRYWKYADPVGAIIVCSFLVFNWFNNAFEQVPALVGVRGEGDHLSRILKLAIDHDEKIKKIDHSIIYRNGETVVVELHIVMDENLPLKVTHDVAHPLEKKLVKLDFVDRAFVHCDYTCDGE